MIYPLTAFAAIVALGVITLRIVIRLIDEWLDL